MWAATRGHVGTAKLLLDKGAEIKVQDKLGLTALKRAQNHGNKEMRNFSGATERRNRPNRWVPSTERRTTEPHLSVPEKFWSG